MWYTTILVYECNVGVDKSKRKSIDIQYHIYKSNNKINAYKKALKIGKENEQHYKNYLKENVFWKYIGIRDIYEIGKSIKDKTEIYYEMKSGDGKKYLRDKNEYTTKEK